MKARTILRDGMQVAIFGATGKTGRELVAQALARGWSVRALARDPARLPAGVDAQAGDARDRLAVRETVRGCDAVVSALGWTKGAPEDLLQRATGNILDAMREAGARRLIVVTGGGVPAPEDEPGIIDRGVRLALRLTAGKMLDDSLAMRDLVRESGLEWTLVRAGRMQEKPAKGGPLRVGHVGTGGTKPFVAHADLARFVLDELEARRHVHGMPFVSN